MTKPFKKSTLNSAKLNSGVPYKNAVDGILKADVQAGSSFARKVREDSAASASEILEQRLVSFRLSLKLGHGKNLNVEEIQPKTAATLVLQAEAHFLRGMILMHQEKFVAASSEMTAAAKLYVEGEWAEKSLLSQYNALIAEMNSGLYTPQQSLNFISEILLESERLGFDKISALCIRQKSYIYFDDRRYLAAFEEIEPAMRIFARQGPVSDYHLSLIHAADCAFESGKEEKAKTLLDYIPEDADARVLFPLAYMKAKVSATSLELNHFEFVSSVWKERYETYLVSRENQKASVPRSEVKKIIWDQNNFWLSSGKNRLVRIKPMSLEGSFLKLLLKSPKSKATLCEALWPEYASVENLDDRFFRLRSRLTQKLGNVISFDGSTYTLTIKVVLQN